MKRIVSLCSLLCCLTVFGLFPGCRDAQSKNWASMPFVKIKDAIFILDPKGTAALELAEAYMEIGSIKETASNADQAQNNASSCCSIGDKIYQAAGSLDEIYVYTALFSGNNTYRFLRFVKA